VFSALIIDADDVARGSIERALGPWGFQFDSSTDAPEAMNLARTSTPDIIFLRVELPSASGFSVCNKLRRSEETKYIPLVMYASDVTDDVFEQHRNLKTRADEYLKLPLDNGRLVEAVRALIPLPASPETGGEELDVDIEDARAGEPSPEDSLAMTDLDADFEEIEAAGEESGAVAVDELGLETDAAFDALMGAEGGSLAESLEPEPEPKPRAARRSAPPPPEPEPEARPSAGGGGTGEVSARREVLNLKAQIVQKDRELLSLREELDERERSILDVKHKNRELQQQLSELESRALSMEEQGLSAQESAEAAARDKETILKREEGLKTRLEVAQKKLKSLEDELATSQQNAAQTQSALREQVGGLEGQLSSERARASELEHERDDLLEGLAAAKDETRQRTEALAAANEKGDRLTETVGQLENELAQTKRNAETELATARAEHARKLEETVQEHQAEAEFQEGQLAKLRAQLAEAKEALDGANAEIDTLTNELGETKKQLGERVTALEADLAELNESLVRVEGELERRNEAAKRAQQALAVALKVLE
jgi:DNA-binding response OmpR family regulator/chromosome segregation ATPase